MPELPELVPEIELRNRENDAGQRQDADKKDFENINHLETSTICNTVLIAGEPDPERCSVKVVLRFINQLVKIDKHNLCLSAV